MKLLGAITLLPALAWCVAGPQYLGNRALGMGGAFTALSDDYSGLYSNPAGLALLNTPMDAGVSVKFDLGDFFGTAGDAVNVAGTHAGNLGSVDQLSQDNTLVDDLMLFDQRPVGFGSIPEMHFAAKSTDPDFRLGLGAAWYLRASATFELNKGVYIPSAQAQARADLAIKVGGSMETLPGFFVGVSPTLATYSHVAQSLNIKDYATAQDSLINQVDAQKRKVLYPGFGLGWDVGALYEIVPTELRLGASVQNMFLTLDQNRVPIIYNLGLAYLPAMLRKQGMLRYVNFALDVDDLSSGKPFLAKLNMGAEMNMTLAQLRGGLRGGYPCFGLGLDLMLFQFDFVSWADELGSYVGQIEDRHYMFSARIGI